MLVLKCKSTTFNIAVLSRHFILETRLAALRVDLQLHYSNKMQ